MAIALRMPPPPVFVADSTDITLVQWASLSSDVLVDALQTFTLDSISSCIRRLLALDRPSVNSRSRRKTCIGLVNHIIGRVRYLESIDLVTLYDILLAYYPFLLPGEPSKASFISRIL